LLGVFDGGGDHGGDARFHIGDSAGVKDFVFDRGLEGVGVPAFEWAGGDDIDMPGEADVGFGLSAVGGVEGAEVVVGEDLGLEIRVGEGLVEEIDASGVAGGEARDGEEGLEEGEGHWLDSMWDLMRFISSLRYLNICDCSSQANILP